MLGTVYCPGTSVGVPSTLPRCVYWFLVTPILE